MIKLALIEDQREIREGLAMLIASREGYVVTGAFASMEQALEKMGDDPPEVVLVDLGLPGMSGMDGIREMKRRWPRMVMLVLTVYEDDERIFEALCAGAQGYLLKKTPAWRLIDSIAEGAAGGAPMSPEVARKVIDLFREHRAGADHGLTPHETRLLKLLSEGHGYRAAAAELGVTVNTVSFHLRSIYQKLEVHSKSEAVAKALRHRIIS